MEEIGDNMIRCPYNSLHIVSRSKFAFHLFKCRKQHKGTEYSRCPFNSSHNVLTAEMDYHCENCPDRRRAEAGLYPRGDPEEGAAAQIEVPPPSENWDDQPEVVSYLDVKDDIMSKTSVYRQPLAMARAEKKKFAKSEAKRFEQITGTNEGASTSGSFSGASASCSSSSHAQAVTYDEPRPNQFDDAEDDDNTGATATDDSENGTEEGAYAVFVKSEGCEDTAPPNS